jgi:hypothetical protein
MKQRRRCGRVNLCRLLARTILQNTGAIHHHIDTLKSVAPIRGDERLRHIDHDGRFARIGSIRFRLDTRTTSCTSAPGVRKLQCR